MSAAIDSMSANRALTELENQLIKDEEYQKKLAIIRAGSMISFNFWAFLFGGFWFIYRKSYIIGWAILAVLFFGGIFFGTNLLAAFGASVIVQVILGLFGNAIYYSDIKRRARIASNLEMSEKSKYIEKNSGAEMGIGLMLGIAAMIAAFVVPAVLVIDVLPFLLPVRRRVSLHCAFGLRG